MKQSYVYILTNQYNTVTYIGVTNNLIKRVYQHKNKQVEGFSKKYNLSKLVYFKSFEDIIEAIKREKQLKKWKRQYKIDLIEKLNPEWKDLYGQIV
jgi:putative endonuclease